mmetsp:Transcript_36566/g.71760  ORF Transcript_36566/g.71760 Transcript_36566/m.71760 type:complete len:133 (+) Transcript_36566:348-746(+)
MTTHTTHTTMHTQKNKHTTRACAGCDEQQLCENCPQCELGIWECLELLDKLVDESDPDTDVSQLQHALMTAEAIRKQYPEHEWFPVVGLVHDLGKILSLKWDEPQWAVVGDTFPVRRSPALLCCMCAEPVVI